MLRWLPRIGLIFTWLLNLAALAGYFLLRRRINTPETASNSLRFHIIRPYKTDTDTQGEIQQGTEQDELGLMANLFATAQGYGNARVVIVANHADPGLPKIRQLAAPFGDIVQVEEALPMPADTISGQMFNHKVGWSVIAPDASDADILLTTDCDSDLTPKLLRQIAKAYEDESIGGVGTNPLYYPALNWAAMPTAMAVNPGFGFVALDAAIRHNIIMAGNLLSMRISVFRQFGGFDGYNRMEQMVDDMATTKKVLSTGKKLEQVGTMPVWNRYSTWSGWWNKWTRWATLLRVAAPDLFYLSPLPTYGAQSLNILVAIYGLISGKRRYVIPFLANWGVNGLYASLTGVWREAFFSPITAPLNMAGWLYVLVSHPKSLRWRGTVVSLDKDENGG